MKSDRIMEDMNGRIVRSFLDVVILLELNKRPLCGSDVISWIHNKYELLMSPGTVYSYLYNLERDGLVKSSLNARRSIFTLTERGKQVARELLEGKRRILNYVSSLFAGE